MSNIIPPMVSSSPPPMDDAIEEDEDDEFGDFAAADDLSYNASDAPQTPSKSPAISNSFWEESVKHDKFHCQESDQQNAKDADSKSEPNGVCNGNSEMDMGTTDEDDVGGRVVVGQDNTSQDSIVSGATDSGLCSASQNSEGASPSPIALELTGERSSPSPVGPELSGEREESSGSDETLVKSVDMDVESKKVFGFVEADVRISSITKDNIEKMKCSPDDFQPVSEITQTFRTDTKMPEKTICKLDVQSERFSPIKEYGISKHLPQENSDVDDFGDFESVDVSEGFAVFESPVVDRAPDNWAVVSQPVPDTSDNNDHDFEDIETAMGSVSMDHHELTQKLETLVNTLFPLGSDTGLVEVNVPPLAESLATVWLRLRDMENSHALSYQWSGSAANKSLLMALGIDSRNILFGPRWNTSVPRFAANLGFSPLEPMRASRNSPTPLEPTKELSPVQLPVEATTSTAAEEAVVPAAQFDWNSSGLVNPLDCANSALLDLDYLNTFDNLTSSSSPPASNMAASAWNISAAPETSTGNALVQRILASNQSVPAARSRHGLSSEAVKVLDELPDLSFLQAKLLMFPVRGTSP